MSFTYKFEMAGNTATMALVHKTESGVQLLLAKRKKDSDAFPGRWSLPGGYLNVGTERVVDTAVRETKEETTLDIDVERFHHFYVDDEVGSDPRYVQVINQCYFVILTDEECSQIKPNDDIDEIMWVNLNDFNIDLAFAHNTIVKELKKSLQQWGLGQSSDTNGLGV